LHVNLFPVYNFFGLLLFGLKCFLFGSWHYEYNNASFECQLWDEIIFLQYNCNSRTILQLLFVMCTFILVARASSILLEWEELFKATSTFVTLFIFSRVLCFYQNISICYLGSRRYFSKTTHSYNIHYLNRGRIKQKRRRTRE
jgi:hypothetical protein